MSDEDLRIDPLTGAYAAVTGISAAYGGTRPSRHDVTTCRL